MRFVVANYKMNGNKKFYVSAQKKLNTLKLKDTKLVLCPPFVYVQNLKIKNKRIFLGVQNISSAVNNKSTGEISTKMLNDLGVKFVIVGHSERRALGESDEIVVKKVINAINSNITPIVCVGENGTNAGLDEVKNQVKAVLKGLKAGKIDKDREIIFAYEPVWAIGTGKIPTISEINKAVKLIRTSAKGYNIKVLYGGSVSGDNYAEIFSAQIDGFLLGGVSLKVDEFTKIVKGVDECEKEFC